MKYLLTLALILFATLTLCQAVFCDDDGYKNNKYTGKLDNIGPLATPTRDGRMSKEDKKAAPCLPESYGAIGDGVADDRAAINACLATDSENIKLTKSFKIYSGINITRPVTITGVGRDGAGEIVVDATFNSSAINVLSEGVTLEKFGIRHEAAWKAAPAGSIGFTVGEAIDYKWGFIARELSIRRFDINASFDGSIYGTIDNVHFWDAKTYSLRLRNLFEPEGGDNFIRGCVFNDFEPDYETPGSDTMPWDNVGYVPVEAHIYQENSSGMYLSGNKIHWGKWGYHNFNNGGVDTRTTVVSIIANSIEGQDQGGQIKVDATGVDGEVQNLLVHNNEMNARENCTHNIDIRGANKVTISGNTGNFYRGQPVGSISLELDNVTNLALGPNSWVSPETGVSIASNVVGSISPQSTSADVVTPLVNNSVNVKHTVNVPVGINTQGAALSYPLTVAPPNLAVPTTQAVISHDGNPTGLFLTSGDEFGGFFSSNAHYNGTNWIQATSDNNATAFGLSAGNLALWHYTGTGVDSVLTPSRSAVWTKGKLHLGDGVIAAATDTLEVDGTTKVTTLKFSGDNTTQTTAAKFANGNIGAIQLSNGSGGFTSSINLSYGGNTLIAEDLSLSSANTFVINNLTTGGVYKALSAEQGKTLSTRIPVIAANAIPRMNAAGTVYEASSLFDNGKVGLGNTAPTTQLHISSDSTVAGKGLTIEQNATAGYALLDFNHSGGTFASKTALTTGRNIGVVSFNAYETTTPSYQTTAQIAALTTGTVSGTSIPTDLVFKTGVNTAGVAERIRIASSGLITNANGGGAPFGSMFTDTAFTVAVASANVWYEADTGATNFTAGLLKNVTHSDHYLVAVTAGYYEIKACASLGTGAAGDKVAISTAVNGTATSYGHGHTTIANASSNSEVCALNILNLAANDQVSIVVQNHSAARDVEIDHAQMTMTYIGSP